MYSVRQQYGVVPERVPKELNFIGSIIYLAEVPHELKALLFRDIGLGDKLVTEKIARDYARGLEELAKRNGGRSKRVLRGMVQIPKDDIFFRF